MCNVETTFPDGTPTNGDSPDRAAKDLAIPVRYLARQPILDLRGRMHGYELLFRSGPGASFPGEADHVTGTMIDSSVVFGVRKLTGGLPAFVPCTAESLTSDVVQALPPSMSVLEVVEHVEPAPEILPACRRLKAEGYRIALDDFIYRPELDPLIRIADYIKIDFQRTGPAARCDTVARLDDFRGALLAKKVETRREYEEARSEGFTLFQGYYFCHPALLARRKVPANHTIHMQLLEVLDERPLNLRLVSELVKRDASLTYRLLRLVNSAAMGMCQEVSSIQAALLAIGDDVFRRVAVLAIASELSVGHPDEILRMAFVRARFCELSASACLLDPTEQYLLGMFSLLPAMLQAPMEEAVADLPLRRSLRAALLGAQTDTRTPLTWLESHERGDWEHCDAMVREHALDRYRLHSDFTEAVVWADDIIAAAL